MPVAIPFAQLGEWIDTSPAELPLLVNSWPAIAMHSYPVSTRVNNVREQDEHLLDPVGNGQLPFD